MLPVVSIGLLRLLKKCLGFTLVLAVIPSSCFVTFFSPVMHLCCLASGLKTGMGNWEHEQTELTQ